ncbi:hypothetical protein [Streptomyces flaveolus]|uniref:hypothetical protein n=1 Tax=Streptomyces flaveolus TaxID=67297 RepID=UPI00367D0977
MRLDPAAGRARAGHPPPIVRHPDGRTGVPDLPGRVALGVDPQAHCPPTASGSMPVPSSGESDRTDGTARHRPRPRHRRAAGHRPPRRHRSAARHPPARPPEPRAKAGPGSGPRDTAVPADAPRLTRPGSVDMGTWSD